MGFDNPNLHGDTSIFFGLVLHVRNTSSPEVRFSSILHSKPIFCEASAEAKCFSLGHRYVGLGRRMLNIVIRKKMEKKVSFLIHRRHFYTKVDFF